MSNDLLHAGSRPSRSRRSAIGRVLELVGRRMVRDRLQGQLRLTLPDGHQLVLGQTSTGGFDAELKVNSYRVLEKCIRRGTVGFGEAYMAGDIDCSDLVSLFRFFLIQSLQLVRHNGSLGMIVPMALLADFSCKRTRLAVLDQVDSLAS